MMLRQSLWRHIFDNKALKDRDECAAMAHDAGYRLLAHNGCLWCVVMIDDKVEAINLGIQTDEVR